MQASFSMIRSERRASDDSRVGTTPTTFVQDAEHPWNNQGNTLVLLIYSDLDAIVKIYFEYVM